tara:strand:+ start:148 stop:417 length:270 start_codon:yes stop_codon:yes gene_type:complete
MFACAFLGGSKIALLLIASAVGYWVLVQAGSQKAKVKKIGQYLGIFIIVISVIGVGCKMYKITTGKGWHGKSGHECAYKNKGPRGSYKK